MTTIADTTPPTLSDLTISVRDTGATSRPREHSMRHYRIGPVPVTLACEVPGIADDFHRYYRRCEVFAPATHSFRIDVVIRRSPRSLRRYFHILANGREQCILRGARSVLPFVEWTMNALVAKFLPHYYQIHAASVSHQGVGVILAGSPGQGKSTLAAGMLARGWSYLSDEFALIDPDTRHLEPFPKAICIKAGSFATLLEQGLPLDLKRVLHKGHKGPVSLLDPAAVRPNAVGPPCPVGLIVFPRYDPHAAPAIEPMSRAQAVFELIQVSFNFSKFRDRGFDLLAAVARKAQCVRLRSGDLVETCELLDNFLFRLSPLNSCAAVAAGRHSLDHAAIQRGQT
ncbi:MAG: hypothetical protein HY718_11285 [Planctomycetes bacterium]|nr:hypothetical protein [Planctomycetota bacterium]